MIAIAVLMTLTYPFVAVERLGRSGIGIFTSNAMPAYILQRSLEHNGFGYEIGSRCSATPCRWAW